MGKIKVTENCNGIEGLKVIEPAVFGDARGYFMETYNYNDFAEAGIDCDFLTYHALFPPMNNFPNKSSAATA